MKKWLFVSILPLFLSASNLNELIELSLKNETYLTQELQSQKAYEEKQAAFRAYLPSLSVQGAYVANNKDRFIIDPKESLYAKLSLSVLLYDAGGREAKLKSLESLHKLAKLNQEYSKNYLFFQASTLFLNYQSVQALIKASEQKELFLNENLKRLEAFYKTGLSSKEELESVRAKAALVKLELAKNKLQLLEISKNIQELCGQNFIPQGNASLKEPGYQSSNSLEIIIAQEQSILAKHQLQSVRAEYFPRFFLQNNLGFYKNNFDINIPNSPILPLQDFANKYLQKHSTNNQFILGFEWKIFDFGATKAKVEAARLEVQMMSLNATYTQRKNKLELNYLIDELKVLKEQINALELSLNASKLAFESVDKKYKAGLKSYTEYLQSLENLFQTRANLELVKNEFEIAKARYYFNAGISIKKRIAS
ncbi:TolC family protein [Campylobacter sp. MIT 12-5580]|uniref:TolC family protein n=1 Tax=Campylobacter sp. MIT 12-5580 TaxID=2040651 RepID=UPI0010F5B01F|nr:TolC family protein [Campylobacter sp. MIT 12-5580]TKX29280.1 TolC family protein [Campylobacter sp. MIT 12-5580]